jgi:hypothetical protein
MFLVIKMTSTSVYVVLLCCLIFINQGLGINRQRKLYEDANDSLDGEQRAINANRDSMPNMYTLNPAYTKDNYNVYFAGQRLDGVIPSSFKSLGNGYGKDSWNVYYMGKKMTGPNASKFEVLSDGYAKDSWDVYYMDQKVAGPSASAFKSLGDGYGKDSWDVYYLGKKIQGASASSFSLIQQVT